MISHQSPGIEEMLSGFKKGTNDTNNMHPWALFAGGKEDPDTGDNMVFDEKNPGGRNPDATDTLSTAVAAKKGKGPDTLEALIPELKEDKGSSDESGQESETSSDKGGQRKDSTPADDPAQRKFPTTDIVGQIKGWGPVELDDLMQLDPATQKAVYQAMTERIRKHTRGMTPHQVKKYGLEYVPDLYAPLSEKMKLALEVYNRVCHSRRKQMAFEKKHPVKLLYLMEANR